MENNMREKLIPTKEKNKMEYERPLVLGYTIIKFETAQSWNKGHGNRRHKGTGNDGIHYPHPPYTGRRPKPWF